MADENNSAQAGKLGLVAGIVSSYLRQNSVGIDQISTVVGNVTRAMQTADSLLQGSSTGSDGMVPDEVPQESQQPAVSIRSSVKPEYIVCLSCGARVKTLRRHLTSAHGLDPKTYREKWGLKRD